MLVLKWVALATLLAACNAPAEPPPPPPATPEPPPADALEASLRAYGRQRAPYMLRLGDAMRGEVGPRSPRDLATLFHSGWCYKVVGVGGDGIEDLDLRLHDPNNVLVERDVTEEPRAALGTDRPVCPVVNGTYRIEVRAARGQGPFAVQVYQSI